MAAYLDKYHVEINGEGYIIDRNRNGQPYYQKKVAPSFVNKFGSGDSSYRDSTFWQFWAQTNWRNGSKQLRLDDPGKFWKSENVNVSELDEITLSKAFVSIGQTASGTKVNSMEAWRNSQGWWNANYGYRQQLTITAPSGTTVPTGYPIVVTTDTAALETATKLRSDRKDWRVIYFNGSSHVDLTRDYVTTTKTVFALQNPIPAGSSDSNYYIYYGYSSESTSKQPTSDTEFNSVYAMFGATPDSNTVSLIHFREGSGTTLNDDKNNNNFSTSGMGWSTSGPFGRAGDFTGTGDKATSTSASFNLGSFTIEAWIKPGGSGARAILGRVDSSDNRQWYLYLDASSRLEVGVKTSGGGTAVVGTTSVSTSTWTHVAGTCDGSGTVKVYVNGTLEGTAVNGEGTSSMSTATTYFGSKSVGGADDYNGYIAHARVSDTNRTSFPYAIAGTSQPTVTNGTEITTQPPASSFDLYTGNSDGKIYKWDGTDTFTEQFDTHRITWYETGNDTNMIIGDQSGTERAQAQSFQVAAQQFIKGVEVYLKKNAGTPGDITVRIETNNTDKPSGTLVDADATATISSFSTTDYSWKTVTFPDTIQLASGTTYWLVLKTATAANDNNYAWAADGSSPTYSNGNNAASADGGSTWTVDTAKDMYFRIKSETTQVNDILVSSVGGTRKMLIATGDITGQNNGNARIFSFDGTNFVLEKVFNTSTESQVTKLAEFNGKLYAGVGPQARIYEGTNPSTWTLSKDIDIPQNPGYIFALKEYNGRLYAGGGSPEFLPDKFYNGFWFVFDTNTWQSLYPFDFTVVKNFEFYDAFLFSGTYHGHIYVYDTATLNPLFNFRDGFGYNVSILDAQLYDDKIFFLLYPQEGSNETNVGIWKFDRHGLSLAHTVSGVTGFRCASVINNTLMVGTGDDGYVYALSSTQYSSQGFVQSSYFDANLPSIEKLYNKVTVQHDPLAAGQSVKVYYKFKESDDWTLLGTSDTVDATEKELSFPSGTKSKKISLKTEVNTSNTATTPKVKESILQYSLYPTRKWLWNIRLLAKKSLGLLDRTTESRTATEIRQDLEDAQNAEQLVTFTDVDGTQYSVLFSDLDQGSWVINQDDVNEDQIAVTLLEA